MMIESINVVKHGVVVRQWPSDTYSLNILGNHVTIQDKESRRVCCVISQNTYDYIEIEREEVNG